MDIKDMKSLSDMYLAWSGGMIEPGMLVRFAAPHRGGDFVRAGAKPIHITKVTTDPILDVEDMPTIGAMLGVLRRVSGDPAAYLEFFGRGWFPVVMQGPVRGGESEGDALIRTLVGYEYVSGEGV